MFIIFGILTVICATAFLMRNTLHRLTDEEMPVAVPGIVGGAGTILFGLLATLQCVSIVEPGYRGVVVVWGNIDERPLQEGFHLINPFAEVHLMDVRVKNSVETQSAQTSDTQNIGIQVILNWRPDPNGVVRLHQNYGADYADIIIPQAVTESVKGAIAQYKLTDLTSERSTLSNVVVNSINDTLNKYDILVLECGLGQIDFSDKYDAAIEEKQRREQEALQRQYELDATRTEAEMAEAKAKGIANSKIAQANGEAQAIRLQAQAEADALQIRAEAQAEYNRKVSDSLSALLINKEYLDRWDGRLPTMMLGENTTPLVMMPTAAK